MDALSTEDVLALLRAKQTGSQVQLAKTLGLSPAYISDVFQQRRTIGPAILDFLGLERQVVVTYRPLARKKAK